jgi:oligopeptide transport system substrate-binding protein
MNRTVGIILGIVAALVLAVAAISIVTIARQSGSEGGAARDGSSGTIARQPTAGILRVPGADPITLDPALAGDSGSATYIVEIFGGLVTLDTDLKIIPDIAEKWDISPDGTTYTFTLRPNVTFHNSGRRVTAADVKYSLERTANPQTGSTTAESYLSDIVGARDMIRGRAQSISGVEVVNDTTLRIKIDSPKSYFLAKLTYPTAFVVDKNQIESNPRNWTRKPNGTGPFLLQDWRIGERIILQANDRYHLGAPKLSQVQFLVAGGSFLTMYENDEIDISGVSLADIERIQDRNDPLNKDYQTGDELAVYWIGFNHQQPPFDDPKVRQAFTMALDRQTISRVVLKDLLPAANSIMQPGLPGYNREAKALEFNPTMAQQLLSESKYGGPSGLPKVTLSESGAGANVGLDTQAILEMWRRNLNVNVEIQQTESGSFFDDLDKGRYQMFSIGWIMDYPDPEDILDIKFHSQSRQNDFKYANPEFDRLVEQARGERDTERRLQMYRDAEQVLLQDAAVIPLYFGKDHLLVKPWVKGYTLPGMVVPKLRYVSVER